MEKEQLGPQAGNGLARAAEARRAKPRLPWPFWCMVAGHALPLAALVWVVAAMARELTDPAMAEYASIGSVIGGVLTLLCLVVHGSFVISWVVLFAAGQNARVLYCVHAAMILAGLLLVFAVVVTTPPGSTIPAGAVRWVACGVCGAGMAALAGSIVYVFRSKRLRAYMEEKGALNNTAGAL